MASSNASWSLLPIELVEKILYKVPVASLVRFKSTCKQWYALLNDKRFIYKHLELSREGVIQVHRDPKLYQFINLETLALSSLQGPSRINSMIHCDGLLLCEIENFDMDRKLAVWNPMLGQMRWIKPSITYSGFDIYGFGYDKVSRDKYKILRFRTEKGHEEVEIYEFKSQLWRSVDYSLAYFWAGWKNQAVSMNGNMYWVVEREAGDKFIQCFDFSREVFRETCCFPFENREDWLVQRLSGFGGDRFSLSFQHEHGKTIQVWVTNKVTDEVVAWSNYFNVTPPYLSIISRGYMINLPIQFIHKTSNRIMLWCEVEDDQNENICVNVYQIGEGVVEKQVETGRYRKSYQLSFRTRCCVFVPSLVPVPK